jgi:hypothetical protein
MTISLPTDMRRLLDDSGVDWRIDTGTRHYKLIVNDEFVTILPKSNKVRNSTWRAHLNAMSHIKRAIRKRRGQR